MDWISHAHIRPGLHRCTSSRTAAALTPPTDLSARSGWLLQQWCVSGSGLSSIRDICQHPKGLRFGAKARLRGMLYPGQTFGQRRKDVAWRRVLATDSFVFAHGDRSVEMQGSIVSSNSCSVLLLPYLSRPQDDAGMCFDSTPGKQSRLQRSAA